MVLTCLCGVADEAIRHDQSNGPLDEALFDLTDGAAPPFPLDDANDLLQDFF